MAGIPWSDKEISLLKRLHADGLTTEQVAASFPGRSASSVRSQMTRFGLTANAPTVEHTAAESGRSRRLISYLKGKTPHDLISICDHLECAPKDVKPLLAEIADHPGLLQTEDGSWLIDDVKADGPEDRTVDLEEARYGRFGVVSDTHIGSKYQQITYLEEAYEHFDKAGVDVILHAGDLTEGDGSLYRGQRFEVFLHGFAAQRDYVVEHYPQAPNGVRTRIVSGNHDESWLKSADVNLVKEICDKREDMEYVGRRGAYINLKDGKVKTYLFHPDGGTAYALSYKVQKYIEGFSSENKPQLLLVGHYHKMEQLFLRNIHAFQAGCFEAQTPYMRAKGIPAALGYWLIEWDLDADGIGIGRINAEFVPKYLALKDDY